MVNNSVILIGRLVADPELRSFPSQTNAEKQIPVCYFRIAVERIKGDGVDFFDVRAAGTTAENVSKYQKKGNLVAVSGALRTNNRKDKNNVTHYNVVLNADSVLFLTPKEAKSENTPACANETEYEDAASALDKLFNGVEPAGDRP